MCRSHFGGPCLHLAPADLHRRTAVTADQVVMVMRRRAAPVDRLPGVGAHHVDEVGGGHRLERAVDGGQADVLTAAAEFVVQFLG